MDGQDIMQLLVAGFVPGLMVGFVVGSAVMYGEARKVIRKLMERQ